MKDVPTDYVACVVDPKGKTFRSEIYPDYKANRPPMPEDLSVQIPLIFEGVQKEGIPFLQVPGIEADDTIGTLTKKPLKRALMSLSPPATKTLLSSSMTTFSL